MIISTAGLQRFGNLASGSGMAGVFDGVLTTSGYTPSTFGWAGVTLSAPTRIDYVDLVSATNGFDASGSNTGITLKLYGKTGPAPSHAADGVLLGQASFVDENSQRTIRIDSADKVTAYAHVWATLSTGVWCVLADFQIYEATGEIPDLDPLAPGTSLFLRSCNDSVPLPYYFAELPQFRIRFKLSESRVAAFDFHADVVHVGVGSDASVPVGYSFRIVRRFGETLAELNAAPFQHIAHAVGGGNVSEVNPQHYGNKTITTGAPSDDPLLPGYHEISILGSGHTYASSTPGLLRVLVESGKGLNGLRVIVFP